MKKNVLALSIAAMIGGLGFMGAASASVIVGTAATVGVDATTVAAGTMQVPTVTGFSLSTGGVGHALLVPYYNAQNGNMTVLHVVNTDTKNGKVVKVRFRGASNSDDVLDFQVLMSPGDVWTAAVDKGDDGYARLVTNDGTCSIPQFTKGSYVSFKNGRLNPNLTGDALANETREGYVEIFNAADIPGVAVYGATSNANSSLYTAIKHVGGTAPCTSSVIQSALYTTDFQNTAADQKTAVQMGLDSPTGGLTGDWYIMNVPNTTVYSGSATALVGKGGNVGNFVAFPQNDTINITTPENFTADPTLTTTALLDKTAAGTGTATTAPVIKAIALDFPDLSTPYYAAPGAAASAAQASVLTQALAVSSVTNQYAKDVGISAKTDWVFSMPTRRYSVALDYSKQTSTTPPLRVYTTVTGTVAGAAVANEYFSKDNTSVVNGQVCVGTSGSVFRDREESFMSGVPVFSPSSATSAKLCGEASVLSFGEGLTAPSVLGASVARSDVGSAAIYENGWGVVSTANDLPAGTGAAAIGLPILGYSVIKLSNAAVTPGVSGTFGITWPHRFVQVNP